MNITSQDDIISRVDVSADALHADIRDLRPSTVDLFKRINVAHHDQLVRDVWSIGMRAIENADAQARDARLADIGGSLLEQLDRQLRDHVEFQQKTIASVLNKFFDPSDGQVTSRLQAFVADHGVVARLLESYVGPQNSVLAQTLARQVGEMSPLFRVLDPKAAEGLVKTLKGELEEVLASEHAAFNRALDPLADDGAVGRFLRALREELRTADEDRAKQLASAVAALDANDESSLINRLVRDTERARCAVLEAINPDATDSPMAMMKRTLTTLLNEQATHQVDLARQQQERQERFEKEVREALIRIETRRESDMTAPRGGLDFEDAVVQFLATTVKGSPCIIEVTANSAGLKTRCKKGDVVLHFTPESAFAGAAIVFEAKRDASYTVERALAELDVARANRNAAVGVFVMARSHAPDGFPRFARHGSSVLVVWDVEDPSFDPVLDAAIMLGVALVARAKTVGDEADIKALRDIETRIEAELARLQKMEKNNEGIRRNSDEIAEEIRKARKQFDALIAKAKSTLRALNIELHDEQAERSSPIAFTEPPFPKIGENSAPVQPANDRAG